MVPGRSDWGPSMLCLLTTQYMHCTDSLLASKCVALAGLGGQKECKGIIPYPIQFSHGCLYGRVMLMLIIFHPAAWAWGVLMR